MNLTVKWEAWLGMPENSIHRGHQAEGPEAESLMGSVMRCSERRELGSSGF